MSETGLECHPTPSYGGGDVLSPTPNQGWGACQAIEDAVVLAECLGAAGDVAAGLRAYEARRRRRTAHIMRQSRGIGWVLQWQHPLACALRDAAIRWIPTPLAERQFASVLATEV